jgi:PLP dependent protein
VRRRIAGAAERAGRDPGAVRLVAVTKSFPEEVCAAALDAGMTDLGENRVQEGVAKAEALARLGRRPVWHLIGHLQSNKVKPALATFDVIHSVDSIDLAHAISRRAESPVAMLLEVNVGGEASKFGFAPEGVPAAYETIATLPKLAIHGLMTVAPQVADPEVVRPVFRRLRELAGSLGLPELSMGMSGDYEVAVEEGATIVRVGSALFGQRPAPGAGR